MVLTASWFKVVGGPAFFSVRPSKRSALLISDLCVHLQLRRRGRSAARAWVEVGLPLGERLMKSRGFGLEKAC